MFAVNPKNPGPFWLAAILGSLTGCAGGEARIARAVTASLQVVPSPADYAIGCPDVIEIQSGHAALNGRYAVEPDGSVHLVHEVRVRLSGRTTDEAARLIEAAMALPEGSVRVVVVRHASRQVMIFGPLPGEQRAVAYHGPETVTQLLARAGGIGPETSPRGVQVVRSHVATGQRPEVFEVDLEAIALRDDRRSDVVVHPYDQVYLNQSRRSAVIRCLPPWLFPWGCRR